MQERWSKGKVEKVMETISGFIMLGIFAVGTFAMLTFGKSIIHDWAYRDAKNDTKKNHVYSWIALFVLLWLFGILIFGGNN